MLDHVNLDREYILKIDQLITQSFIFLETSVIAIQLKSFE